MNDNLLTDLEMKTVIESVVDNETKVRIFYTFDYTDYGFITKSKRSSRFGTGEIYFFSKKLDSMTTGWLGTNDIVKIVDMNTKQVLYPVA